MVSDVIRKLSVRIAGVVSRAVVKRVDDSKKRQAVQVALLAGETREALEHFQPYGFTSVPQTGAEGVALFPGGERDHGLVVAVDDRRYRLTGLQSGEVALYTDQGDKLVLKRDGTIEVTAATKVVVSAPLVEIAGNTEAAMKGTTYRAAESVSNGTVATQLLSASNALVAAANAELAVLAPTSAAALVVAAGAFVVAGTAIQTLEASAGTFLSTKVKLS